MRVIPPIKAIIYFEAAARLQSFKLAAEELYVTPGAVSHQINTLENFIEQKLFHRHNRSISLTNAGQRYYSRTSLILNDLEQATTDLGVASKSQKLTIAVPPTLLNKWLLPHLDITALSQQGLSIHFIEALDALDFNKANIDLAIYYGLEPPNEKNEHLFQECMVAVCRPDYLPSGTDRLAIETLHNITLIETTNRLMQWDLILHHFKIKPLADQSKLFFDNSMQTIEAARHGFGIAFVNRLFVQPLLDNGELIEVFDIEKLTVKKPSYYLVCPQDKCNTPAVSILYRVIVDLTKQHINRH